MKSQTSQRSHGNPPRRWATQPRAGGAARLDASVVLRSGVRVESSQAGEEIGASTFPLA